MTELGQTWSKLYSKGDSTWSNLVKLEEKFEFLESTTRLSSLIGRYVNLARLDEPLCICSTQELESSIDNGTGLGFWGIFKYSRDHREEKPRNLPRGDVHI